MSERKKKAKILRFPCPISQFHFCAILPLPMRTSAASSPPPAERDFSSGRQSGRSSGVEHNLAKVGVEGSNPFARSSFLYGNQWISGLRAAFSLETTPSVKPVVSIMSPENRQEWAAPGVGWRRLRPIFCAPARPFRPFHATRWLETMAPPTGDNRAEAGDNALIRDHALGPRKPRGCRIADDPRRCARQQPAGQRCDAGIT